MTIFVKVLKRATFGVNVLPLFLNTGLVTRPCKYPSDKYVILIKLKIDMICTTIIPAHLASRENYMVNVLMSHWKPFLVTKDGQFRLSNHHY